MGNGFKTLIGFLFCVTLVVATSPNVMNFQFLLRNTSTNNTISGSCNTNISLWSAESGGVMLWNETGTQSINGYGVLDHYIGSIKPLLPEYFSSQVYFQFDLCGDVASNRAMASTVPYAFISDNATTANIVGCGGVYGSVSDLCTIVDTDTDTTYTNGTGLLLIGTQFSLDISFTDLLYFPIDGKTGNTSKEIFDVVNNGSFDTAGAASKNITFHEENYKHGNTSSEIAVVKVNNATHADSASNASTASIIGCGGIYGSVSDLCSLIDTTIPDTNETYRFNNLVSTDCAGTDKMIGVQSNGSVLCAVDELGIIGGDRWIIDDTYITNVSDRLTFNTTTGDNRYINTGQYGNITKLNVTNDIISNGVVRSNEILCINLNCSSNLTRLSNGRVRLYVN